MNDFVFEQDLNRLQQDPKEITQAIEEIYNTAVESADAEKLGRIVKTYPRDYLSSILGGYPEWIDEILDEEGEV